MALGDYDPYEELRKLLAENERLKAKRKPSGFQCCYCREQMFADTEEEAIEVFKAHAETCESHPMFALRARLAAAEAVCEAAAAYFLRWTEETYDNLDEALDAWRALKGEA